MWLAFAQSGSRSTVERAAQRSAELAEVSSKSGRPEARSGFNLRAVSSTLSEYDEETLPRKDQLDVRRQSYARYLDTYQWRDPAGTTEITLTLPREEIVVTPVSAH
jgi:hypothetical protein